MLEILLDYVRKTNPEMTLDKLRIELGISEINTMALIMVSGIK